MKKGSWSSVKQILFTFLAISKIMYYYTTVAEMRQSDLEGAGQYLMMRILNRDLLLLGYVVIFFVLDKLIFEKGSKREHITKYVIFYAVGFIAVFGFFWAYTWIASLFFSAAQMPGLLDTLVNSAVTYIIVIVALNIKNYFKNKEKPEVIHERNS